MATNGFLGINYAKSIIKGMVGKTNGSIFPGSAYLAILKEAPTYNSETSTYNISDLEVVSTGYKRERIGYYNDSYTTCFGDPVLNDDGTISISNNKQIKFDKATTQWLDKNGNAEFGWYAVMSAQTDGDIIFAGPLSTAITVKTDESVNIAVGAAKVTINVSVTSAE